MFKNKLIILTAITVAVIIAASVFVNLRAPQTEKDKPAFFPDLVSQIESVNHIVIKGYAEEIHLSRQNENWGIDEFDGYPALPDKVKSTVLGVADLKINSSKTALPRLYHRLGVEGPEVEDTSSLLLILQDNNKEKLIEVIIGKPRRSSASQSAPGLYIREPDNEQSYLVDGIVDISPVKTDWIERTLFDIPEESIKSVRINHPDGDTFTLFKSDPGQENYELEDIPSGKKMTSNVIIKRFGTILQDMQISGALSKETLSNTDDVTQVRVSTFEGVTALINVIEFEDFPYASFEFSFDDSLLIEDEVKDKADEIRALIDYLNLRTKDWWFEIPGFKYDIMKKRSNAVMRNDVDDLILLEE